MADPVKNRIHPLVATAAVAVTLVCLVGVAAITGLLPTSHSNINDSAQVAAITAPAPQSSNQPAAPSALQHYSPPSSHYVAQQHPAAPRHRSEPTPAAPICYDCGRVESIQAVQQAAKPSGLGIAAGAILGGVLGHQVGHGNGNTLATVAGAVGGGFAGNEVEARTRTTTSYRVEVRMENGTIRSFPQSQQEWRVGDPVRVVNGHLEGRG